MKNRKDITSVDWDSLRVDMSRGNITKTGTPVQRDNKSDPFEKEEKFFSKKPSFETIKYVTDK